MFTLTILLLRLAALCPERNKWISLKSFKNSHKLMFVSLRAATLLKKANRFDHGGALYG